MEGWIKKRLWGIIAGFVGLLVFEMALLSKQAFHDPRLNARIVAWDMLAMFAAIVTLAIAARKKRRLPDWTYHPSARSLRSSVRNFRILMIVYTIGLFVAICSTEFAAMSWAWRIGCVLFSLSWIALFYWQMRQAQKKLKEVGEST